MIFILQTRSLRLPGGLKYLGQDTALTCLHLISCFISVASADGSFFTGELGQAVQTCRAWLSLACNLVHSCRPVRRILPKRPLRRSERPSNALVTTSATSVAMPSVTMVEVTKPSSCNRGAHSSPSEGVQRGADFLSPLISPHSSVLSSSYASLPPSLTSPSSSSFLSCSSPTDLHSPTFSSSPALHSHSIPLSSPPTSSSSFSSALSISSDHSANRPNWADQISPLLADRPRSELIANTPDSPVVTSTQSQPGCPAFRWIQALGPSARQLQYIHVGLVSISDWMQRSAFLVDLMGAPGPKFSTIVIIIIPSVGPWTWYIPRRFAGIVSESYHPQHQAASRQIDK
ncbi:unnamed protein product [Protopolystoma xenopodis]|uniref:Uncharacterized protein n=1 Tax=Protopolystoma xenopodis TaxID=117903 RepID=A0A3S5AFS4_9PLAT|nr:unnamed protein product [Protopolystoma xenopodis]